MVDLADQFKPTTTLGASGRLFEKTPPRRPHVITIHFSNEEKRWLQKKAVQLGSMVEILRALVDLAMDDPELTERVIEQVVQTREAELGETDDA